MSEKVTKFIEYADTGYNGILMLIFQAIHAQCIWGNKVEYNLNDLLENL